MSARFVCLWCLFTLLVSLLSRAQMRALATQRCALDGALISAAARVDMFEASKLRACFCSIECALAWPLAAAHGVERRFQVHEEQNGIALDPIAAFFVRSNLRSSAGRPLLRAFQDPVAAAQHVSSFGGALVPNPFPRDD